MAIGARNLPNEYLSAIEAFEAADRDLQRLSGQLESLAYNIVNYPDETCFVGLDIEPVPRLDELMPGRRWEAGSFPTADELQAALRRRLLTRAAANELWTAMTSAQRKGAPLLRR